MATPRQQLDDAMRAAKGGRRMGRAKWTLDSRGRRHPSGEEAAWFDQQYARADRGEIEIIAIEPSFRIEIDGAWICNVKADLKVREGGRVRVLDYKGRMGATPVSALKRRLVAAQHKIEIELVGPHVERERKAKAKRALERSLLKRARK